MTTESETVTGWLFDVYAAPEGWVVWLVADDGRRLRVLDLDWQPGFCLHGPSEALRRTTAQLASLRVPLQAAWTTRRELFSDRELEVLQVRVQRPFLHPKIVARLTRTLDPRVQVFNCDLGLASEWFYDRNLFPTARCRAELQDDRLLGIVALDDPWQVDYPSPMDSLRVLELRPVGDTNPGHRRRWQIEFAYEGLTYQPEPESPRDLIERLNHVLDDYDPDVLLTDWGDSFLLPRLLRIASTVGVPLHLHREAGRESGRRVYPRMAEKTGRVRSYVQYGRMVHQPASYALRGRWHIDRQNCFLWREGQWEGVLEIARVAKLSVQHMARTSVGRGITAMQLETLHRQGYLIPWRKREPEEFKSAEELITADKGGLVFHPRPGFYENVAEIDFAAMYPTLMVAYNLSPETVLCRCCERTTRVVPETGYRICDRREGFVPQTLRPILQKRAQYKQLRESAADPAAYARYDARQSALKWLLVVCFGYLGYRNARFGRIEAHESTTSWSREILLQAKEVAEELGFEMLHAIVDCVWVRKAGASFADYEALNHEIARRTGLPTALEGVYRWIHFVPSVANPRLGVPNRYCGVLHNGKTKVRGLALRKHDTPRFIAQVQRTLVEHFARARNLAEYRALIPAAQGLVEQAAEELRSGLVDSADVTIFRSLSQPPAHYQKASHLAIAAKQLSQRGLDLHPGEGIEYVVTNARHAIAGWRAQAAADLDDEWSYDPVYYETLLRRACAELIPTPA